MKQIQPVSIWYNGIMVSATIYNMISISDNLSTSATFWYAILDNSLQQVSQGNLTMVGDDYTAYQTNQYAWDWIATTLGLTITGEYIPPTPAPTTDTSGTSGTSGI